jgi:hypothetical protein
MITEITIQEKALSDYFSRHVKEKLTEINKFNMLNQYIKDADKLFNSEDFDRNPL